MKVLLCRQNYRLLALRLEKVRSVRLGKGTAPYAILLRNDSFMPVDSVEQVIDFSGLQIPLPPLLENWGLGAAVESLLVIADRVYALIDENNSYFTREK